MFPMLVRDVLLTLAAHEFFSPKWSPRIRDEWTVVTFNLADFAASHLSDKLQIEVIHPDDFVMDLVDLNEKRAVAAFRELRARKTNPPMDSAELIRRLRDGGLVQTSLWLNSSDVVELI
jgi:hypothetical protein